MIIMMVSILISIAETPGRALPRPHLAARLAIPRVSPISSVPACLPAFLPAEPRVLAFDIECTKDALK